MNRQCFFRDWRNGGQQCPQEGTVPDPETPAMFVNPQDPDGPTVGPVHCPEHHRVIMDRRDENEASFNRIFRR